MDQFFLDVRLVVFPVRTPASEGEAMLRAVVDKLAVQGLAALVGVELEQDEGQPTTDEFQCSEDVVLALARHARTLGPTAGDIGRNQREQILAAIADATIDDQVDL